MIIYVDIDKTICRDPNAGASGCAPPAYDQAIPIPENITKVNLLHDQGHAIIYWTARGSKTGLDWQPTTERQLREWGAKYNELKMGKPYYDLFIDDKAFRIEELNNYAFYPRIS